MNILDEIVAYKKTEVAMARLQKPSGQLERSEYFRRHSVSLSKAVVSDGKAGIIGEFKRRSPSKGELNPNVSIESASTAYVKAGVSALSVLTDQKYFGGTIDDLQAARRLNGCPILRKDFTVDEYQIIEAKAIGADAILLIAAALDAHQAREFARLAHSLGLEVLLEIHNREELDKMSDVEADLIGVNNRNLKTFEVNVDTSRRLAAFIPDSVVKVSESGISDVATIHDLREYGFQGFLMGERFMKATNPGEAAQIFIESLIKSGKAKA